MQPHTWCVTVRFTLLHNNVYGETEWLREVTEQFSYLLGLSCRKCAYLGALSESGDGSIEANDIRADSHRS
jgi:hypothetical protein